MNILNKSLVAMFGFCMMSATALADLGIATISDVSGKVLVNAGEGFVPAAADMVLKVGDRVFVGEQSLATLSYEKCAVLLDKPAVVTVSADGGCSVATSVQPVADVYYPSGTPGAAAPAPALAGLPLVLLTAGPILAVTCAVACNKLFKDNENGLSGQ